MLTLLLSTALAAGPLPAAVPAIESTLTAFTEGVAARDVAQVRATLHADARQFVRIGGKLEVIETPAYLSLLEAGTIGGTPTVRTLHGIDVSDGQALVRQTRTAGELTFHDAVTLVQNSDQWSIVAMAVTLEGVP